MPGELERFDEKLGVFLDAMREDDMLIITADHGNDPTYQGTDHTREQVPFLLYSPSIQEGKRCPRRIPLRQSAPVWRRISVYPCQKERFGYPGIIWRNADECH